MDFEAKGYNTQLKEIYQKKSIEEIKSRKKLDALHMYAAAVKSLVGWSLFHVFSSSQ